MTHMNPGPDPIACRLPQHGSDTSAAVTCDRFSPSPNGVDSSCVSTAVFPEDIIFNYVPIPHTKQPDQVNAKTEYQPKHGLSTLR